MSIYCSYLTFDGNEQDAPRPLVHRGSHLLPHNKDKRQGEGRRDGGPMSTRLRKDGQP